MVKFRRSMKSDKTNSTPSSISIPAKDAIAIIPPKKVIKAMHDYQAPDTSSNSGYLSFSQGDFLHVVGRETDEDWYEACNPLQGTRGLVPAKYFEIVGKTVRDSGGSTTSGPPLSAPMSNGHDSGYAENSTSPGVISNNGSNGGIDGAVQPMRMSQALRKGTGAMVYGVVVYDFKAERPDELDAKEGEAIIVIAQSNPEWFVAKPITRLGGPGLIPVSFIEIRDMATGAAVPDPQEAIRRAGVPRVEEWKRMAAEYKNGSIPLGKLDSNQAQMQQGMERMSLGNRSQFETNSYSSGQPNGRGYSGQNQYAQSQSQSQSPRLLAPLNASVPRYMFADDIFWFVVETQMEDGKHWELQRLYQDFYDLQINLIQEFPHEAGNVEGYNRSLPYMPGPVTYVTDNISNGRRANLDEYIRNLLQLPSHITQGYLVRKFFAPRENDWELLPEQAGAGRNGKRDSEESRGSISDPNSAPVSQQSSSANLNAANNSSAARYGEPHPAQHQRSQASISSLQGQGHYRSNSQQGLGAPAASSASASMHRQNSSLTQTSSANSLSNAPIPSNAVAQQQPPPPQQQQQQQQQQQGRQQAQQQTATKIKVWFEQDNCVVIRMPPSFSFADLYKKIRERRSLERIDDGGGEGEGEGEAELLISYRDERRGTLERVSGDEELREAMGRVGVGKLVLDVSVVS
ncbi:hypothetical protein LTS18_001738 [Coniosporium uncinatum]|uniref:Uncharacterized protein n=1 Tax=Coniosporium uncinatum TaxID=93489 RepID=A0ACC3DUS1_9PEZI|nr:hypothetical protein LTS18_001738 [Coniosporium uncinatum]